ncbi:hypothetical protein [Tenacibaculum sp. SDUM215027]|uniref:hypothetical protein n=1 Tax=Tenacibaculum sp. SDUM215027 TaxID=3422596 RepID=UPI003D31B36F
MILLYVALLASCNNTSQMERHNNQEAGLPKLQISQTKIPKKQYEIFKKQIHKENELKRKIQAAEKQITYTTYYYLKGITPQITLHLNKNGTGYIKNNITNKIYNIVWVENKPVINFISTTNKKLPFNKLKRLDRKTLLYQSDTKGQEKHFYGKLTDENNLEILSLIESMESNTSTSSQNDCCKLK